MCVYNTYNFFLSFLNIRTRVPAPNMPVILLHLILPAVTPLPDALLLIMKYVRLLPSLPNHF